MSWTIGSETTITWTVAGGSFVSFTVEYSKDGGSNWSTLTSGLSADTRSYAYTPVAGDETTNGIVRVSGISPGRTHTDTNSSAFSTNPVVTLTAPNGSESWEPGHSESITWTKSGTFTSFDLDLSTDNGSNWTSIATGIDPGDTSYAWTIPESLSATCLVRITGHSAGDDVTDQSNAVFTIAYPAVWPGSTLMESIGSCVSAWYADDAVMSGDTVSTLPDVEDGGNWSGGSIERIGNDSIGADASPATAISYSYSGANAEWKSVISNANGRLVSPGLTFAVRAKTFGRYEWRVPGGYYFNFYVNDTTAYLRWNNATTQTVSVTHGQDTTEFGLWTVTAQETSAPTVTVKFYYNGVQVGSNQTMTNSSRGPGGEPTGYYGTDGSIASEALAAGAFAGILTTGQMLSFVS